ncbi:MAG: hypothetical protein OEY51_00670 [Cyclobacteriaceae bacterium]|nr:hypothetical protein [Cyclobacteriaceae bacterium]
MKRVERYFICLFAVILPVFLYGQDDDWVKSEGDLETVEIDVVGSKEIILPSVARLFDPVPPQPIARAKGELDYSFSNYAYEGAETSVVIRPRKIKAMSESKLYGNYVRAGYGNYNTPYLDAYLANKRQKEYSYGINLNYLNSFRGPVDGKNSGAGEFGARAFGAMYGDKATLLGSLEYRRDMLHYYGYATGDSVAEEDISQYYNRIKFLTEVRSADIKSDFQYSAKMGLRNMTDRYGAKETDVFTDINTSLEVTEDVKVLTGGGVHFLTRKGEGLDVINRVLARGNVSGLYYKDRFTLQAGMEIAYFNDTLAGRGGVKIYPGGKVRYFIKNNFEAYASLGGGVKMASLMDITEENPYLNTSAFVANTTVPMEFEAGLSGNVKNILGLGAGIHWSGMKNAHFYVNSLVDSAMFDIVYDTGTISLLNPFVTIQFNQEERYRIGIRGDYYGYKMDYLETPWHKPEFKLTVNSKFNIGNKMVIGVESFVLGGIKARDYDLKEIPLNTIIDLNLGLEYIVGPRFSAFINLNNILGNNYSLYNRYMVKGFQVLGGIAYRF